MLRLSYNSLYELLRAYYIYPHKKNNQLQLSPMTYYYSARCFSVGVLSWPRDSFHSTRWCWLCILHVSSVACVLWALLAARPFLSRPSSVHLWKLSWKRLLNFIKKKTKGVFRDFFYSLRWSKTCRSKGRWDELKLLCIGNFNKMPPSDGKSFNHAWNDSFKRFN